MITAAVGLGLGFLMIVLAFGMGGHFLTIITRLDTIIYLLDKERNE